MFTNISYQSNSAQSKNIDMFSVKNTYAWILDGANGLFPAHISDASSDAQWFVEQLSTFLKQNLGERLELNELMKQAMITTRLKFQKFDGYQDLCDMNMPSSACAILKADQQQLHYFILGNCEVVLHYKDGHILNLTDFRLQQLDGKLLQISEQARRKKRMPMYQVKDFMNQMFIENRLRRNVEDGFYILGEDENAANHAITGVLPLEDVKQIFMICNGFSQYYNHDRVMGNLEKYLDKTRNAKLIENYDYLLKKQPDDITIARSLQNELSDQSTMICFDVDTSIHIGFSNSNKKVQ